MLMISLFVWLGVLVALAAGLNTYVTKRPNFNGAYVFLLFAAVGAPIFFLAKLSEDRYFEAGSALGIWLWPSVLAYFLGRRFVAKHPFFFPSVLWNRGSTNTAHTQAGAPASADGEPKQDDTPFWMK